ncbi:MAG: hypothetical protein J6R39_02370 [Oscillospiraceae bacterium]|nr:hypothetical protein [Oscillospiraceae bacterium]
MNQLEHLLQEHYVNYPELTAQDAVKFLYQRFMGPGHLLTDEAAAAVRLREEWDAVRSDPSAPLFTALGGGLCRLHLGGCKALGLSPGTVARLFFLTAQEVTPDPDGLERALELVRALPLPPEQVEAYLAAYRAQGLPMVSHSDRFRKCYSPAYRIVKQYYVNIIPLLAAIDRARDKDARLRVAIDGPCASGKSTLGKALADIYHCPLVHMDDFFLRPEQRTPQRLEQPGGNVDYERFAAEVLAPMVAGEDFSYRPWNCQRQAFDAPVAVPAAPLTVVEGSYCLREDLRDAYALRIWAHADWDSRRARLLARDGEGCLARFEQLWIPLEERYFDAMQVASCCHLSLDLSGR